MRISDWSSDVCSSDLRGISPEAAAIELVVADRGRVDTIYETMSEANLRRALAWPFTAVGSDAPAIAAEGAFLNSKGPPRTYGRFGRVLGRTARDDRQIGRAPVCTPATNEHIVCRRLLAKTNI